LPWKINSIMKKIKVDLNDRSYDIISGSGIIKEIKQYVENLKFSKIVIITDTNVAKLYGLRLLKLLKPYKAFIVNIPPGEDFKKLYTVSAVYDQMATLKLHRDTLLIAFGGGVVGDLAGFAAATYMRGIYFIQIPTTLLAQVDASIGGKTGVDHASCKNLIGAFYQPKFVLIDTDFLKTLPMREIKTGLAEVVKYGIIKDPELFELLEANPKTTPDFWIEIVRRCAAIKAEVVSKDEKESHLRMILNFGHTFGHAIESLTNYSTYTHGEAIAIGMFAASNLAFKLEMLKEKDLIRIVSLISRLGLPTKCDLKASDIIKTLYMDKKAKSGKARFVLPVKIGKVVVVDNVSDKKLKEAFSSLPVC